MHSWSYYVTLPKDDRPEVDDNRDPQMSDDEAMDYPLPRPTVGDVPRAEHET